jgi:hypothetical protein
MKRKYIGWAAVITALVIILIIVGYQVGAAGFNVSHTVTVATARNGTSPATVTTTQVEVPAKTFWDWLQPAHAFWAGFSPCRRTGRPFHPKLTHFCLACRFPQPSQRPIVGRFPSSPALKQAPAAAGNRAPHLLSIFAWLARLPSASVHCRNRCALRLPSRSSG